MKRSQGDIHIGSQKSKLQKNGNYPFHTWLVYSYFSWNVLSKKWSTISVRQIVLEILRRSFKSFDSPNIFKAAATDDIVTIDLTLVQFSWLELILYDWRSRLELMTPGSNQHESSYGCQGSIFGTCQGNNQGHSHGQTFKSIISASF